MHIAYYDTISKIHIYLADVRLAVLTRPINRMYLLIIQFKYVLIISSTYIIFVINIKAS